MVIRTASGMHVTIRLYDEAGDEILFFEDKSITEINLMQVVSYLRKNYPQAVRLLIDVAFPSGG